MFSPPVGDDGVIGEYHGAQGISPSFPVYSNSTVIYVEIETDYSVNDIGFIFNYTAVSKLELMQL